MTDYNTLLLERLGTEDRLARITLNRPEKMNALTGELFSELNDCLHDLEADQSCRVIILRGAGRCFSAGYDLTPGRERRPGEPALPDRGRQAPGADDEHAHLDAAGHRRADVPVEHGERSRSPSSTATPWPGAANWP